MAAQTSFLRPTDQLSSHVCNGKRSYQQLSPLPMQRTKRARIASNLQQFTEAEELILQGAAKILRVPLKSLMAVADILLQSKSVHSPLAECDRTLSSWDHDIQSGPTVRPNPYSPHLTARVPSRDQNSDVERPPCVPALNRTNIGPDNFAPFDSSLQSDAASFHREWTTNSANLDDLSSFGPTTQVNADSFWNPFTVTTTDSFPLDGFEHLDTDIPTTSHASSVIRETTSCSADSTPKALQAQSEPGLPSTLPSSPFLGPSWADWTGPSPPPFTNPNDIERDSTRVTDDSTRRKQRGPFQDEAQRIETGMTRRIGACISCKTQKIRCVRDPSNLNGCCKTCTQAARRRIHSFPCLRYNLPDAELLDHGKCPRPSWTKRWQKMEILDIRKWESPEEKTICITQDVERQFYSVIVRKFVLEEDDATARKWKFHGADRLFECTPYAIADMRAAGRTLSDFADRTLASAIRFYIDDSDVLLRNTYTMAYRYSKCAEREEERAVLRATLRLWNASRMESRSDRICGDESLGMKAQNYGPEDPNTGKILTHPVFSAQLEVIVVASILKPAKKDVLRRLSTLISEQRRSWFTVYLCMFILLHSCALLTASANKKARKQDLQSRYFYTPIVESLHNGAKILLAYFHFCNRGSHPFTMDWSSPDQIALSELNAEQVAFIQETSKEIEKRAPLFRKIRENGEFEHDWYFLSDLFERDWKPRHTI